MEKSYDYLSQTPKIKYILYSFNIELSKNTFPRNWFLA